MNHIISDERKESDTNTLECSNVDVDDNCKTESTDCTVMSSTVLRHTNSVLDAKEDPQRMETHMFSLLRLTIRIPGQAVLLIYC